MCTIKGCALQQLKSDSFAKLRMEFHQTEEKAAVIWLLCPFN